MLLADNQPTLIDLKNTASFREDPVYHIGAIDETATSLAGGWFAGWGLERATARPAAAFIVKSSVGAMMLSPNYNRNDLVKGFGPDAVSCGFRSYIPLTLIQPLFAPDVKYYAFNGDDIITQLVVNKTNDKLAQYQILTENDFYRLVQTPSTRISDTAAITHLALHALARSEDSYVLSAASACILGYRLLEGEESAQQRRDFIMSEILRILQETPSISRGLFVRWHTSLRLIAGYLFFQDGRDADALIHFSAIFHYFIDLKRWPQALTNILIGISISGYLLYQEGEIAKAIDTWSKAEDILRYGASVAEFQNFYAYGELGNAVQVAQFCHTAVFCAEKGGVLNDPSIAPLNTTIDVSKIIGPFSRLVALRRKIAR
jgi:hypothetical protein